MRAIGSIVILLASACAGRSIHRGEGGSEGGEPGSSGSQAAGATSGRGGTGGTAPGGRGGAGTGNAARPIVPPHGPSTVACGNGQHDEAEECDDGNKNMRDGCGFACQVEVDWTCPEVGPCTRDPCGNGWLARYEECDDGNAFDGDGCSAGCIIEKGWVCPVVGLACRPYCGDFLIVGEESCDNGNRESGDGCSRACRVELPECGSLGAPAGSGTGGTSAGELACAEPVCGDGVAMAPEDCDEGTLANDGRYGGCNADCSYAPFCGDGIVNGAEECDTWPDVAPYGEGVCTPACRFAPYCGDGLIDAAHDEQCDNPPYNGKSFCKSNCLISLD